MKIGKDRDYAGDSGYGHVFECISVCARECVFVCVFVIGHKIMELAE